MCPRGRRLAASQLTRTNARLHRRLAACLLVAAGWAGFLGGSGCAAPALAADESLDERRARVEQLPQEELEELQRKREAFDGLPPERQNKLRELHRELEADPRSAELRETLQHYSAWLRTLPAGRRAELLGLPVDERLAQVKQLLEQQRREQEQRMPRPTGRSLQGEDSTALTAWIEELVGRHEEEIISLIPPGFFRDRLRQSTDATRRRVSLYFALSRVRTEAAGAQSFPTDEDIQQLAERLSAEPQRELQALPGRKERLELVNEWSRSLFFTKFQPQQPSREELEKFFREEINANDRAWLEGLPPERFARELRRYYLMQTNRRGLDSQRGPMSKQGPPGSGPDASKSPRPKPVEKE